MVPHFFMYYLEMHRPSPRYPITAVEGFFILSGFVLGPQIIPARNGATGRRCARSWLPLDAHHPSYLVVLLAISLLPRDRLGRFLAL
jgi:hypothetical protein